MSVLPDVYYTHAHCIHVLVAQRKEQREEVRQTAKTCIRITERVDTGVGVITTGYFPHIPISLYSDDA